MYIILYYIYFPFSPVNMLGGKVLGLRYHMYIYINNNIHMHVQCTSIHRVVFHNNYYTEILMYIYQSD